MKKLIGIPLILIGAVCPILTYIFYCNLITIYNCGSTGAQISCILSGAIITISFCVTGIRVLTEEIKL